MINECTAPPLLTSAAIWTDEHSKALDFLKQNGTAVADSPDEERILTDIATAGFAEKNGDVFVQVDHHPITDAHTPGKRDTSEPPAVAHTTKRHPRRMLSAVGAGLVLALTVYGLTSLARTSHRSPLSPDAIFAGSSPAVVQVVIQDRQGRTIGTGSGFLVSTEGLIATNYHVVKNAYAAHVLLADETKLSVSGAVALDKDADLVIIKAAGHIRARPLELAGNDLPPVGAKVYAIGNPEGLTQTLSDGLVSAHRGDDQITVIQTTAPISQGSSGGPLLGADGKVVGVTTAFLKVGQNLNFAVPASHVAMLLRRCEGDRQLTRFPLAKRTDAYTHIQSGDGWRKKKEYDKAIEDFDEAIRLDPKCALAYHKRGYVRELKNDYDRAIQDYDTAIRLDPTDATYFWFRGDAWAEKKDFDRAIKDFSEAIRLDPKDADHYLRRGVIWLDKKEHDRAIQDYESAVRLDPTISTTDGPRYAVAYYRRGSARSSSLDNPGPEAFKESYRKAIQDYSEAIRLDPGNAGYYSSRGSARSILHDYDSAIQDYDKAIQINPKDRFAYSGRGSVWNSKYEYDRAISDYDQAIRLEPGFFFDYSGRGDAWAGKQFYDNAIADYNQAIRLWPGYAYCYFSRGNAWLAKRNYDQALRDYDQAIRLDPAIAPAVDVNRRIAWSRRMGR